METASYSTVGEYLQTLNSVLRKTEARILGEICNVKIYPGRSYLYFSIKDASGNALLNCFMWQRDYALSGVILEEGLEAIVSGYPKIYEPNGGLSFQTEAIELVGEGALKKAYEKLKEKLTKEGIFEETRKRPIPKYPLKIGVITSKDGAVLSDFTSNIGKFGFQILFVNSRVEGAPASRDLRDAVLTLKKRNIDVLVIMRGGGSLESFAAFNNESLTRMIAEFPAPVIAGIGHDKDICLVSLAADRMVSTPTAVAELLNRSWNEAGSKVELLERDLLGAFSEILSNKKVYLERSSSLLKERSSGIGETIRTIRSSFEGALRTFGRRVEDSHASLDASLRDISESFKRTIEKLEHLFALREKELYLLDPKRELSRGYSIIRSGGKILKSASHMRPGDIVDILFEDGEAEAKVIHIKRYT